jgi:hypothetical protein
MPFEGTGFTESVHPAYELMNRVRLQEVYASWFDPAKVVAIDWSLSNIFLTKLTAIFGQPGKLSEPE